MSHMAIDRGEVHVRLATATMAAISGRIMEAFILFWANR